MRANLINFPGWPRRGEVGTGHGQLPWTLYHCQECDARLRREGMQPGRTPFERPAPIFLEPSPWADASGVSDP